MARLVRTQVEMEGRYEDRWTLVEDDATPEYDSEEALAVVGQPHHPRLRRRPGDGRGPVHLRHRPAGDAACRRAAQPPRQRPRRRRSTSRPPRRSPACAR